MNLQETREYLKSKEVRSRLNVSLIIDKRAGAGLTQEEFASALKCCTTTVSRLENPHISRIASVDTVIKILKCLKLDIEDVILPMAWGTLKAIKVDVPIETDEELISAYEKLNKKQKGYVKRFVGLLCDKWGYGTPKRDLDLAEAG